MGRAEDLRQCGRLMFFHEDSLNHGRHLRTVKGPMRASGWLWKALFMSAA